MYEEELMNKEFECEFCGKKTATLKEYFLHYQECSEGKGKVRK